MIYLDHNATTPPTPQAVEAATRMLSELWANPSSPHRAGQAARREIELARERLARLVGAQPAEVVFTATATESIDLAIRGTLDALPLIAPGAPPPLVITTPIEHEAVRMLCDDLHTRRLAQVSTLAVDDAGRTDPRELDALLREAGPRAAVVSIQWANNETGVVQPMARLSAVCRAHAVRFHTDATQAVGKVPVAAGLVDLLTLAGHKFHAPKGVGALIVRRGTNIARQTHGVQELERRGGTENAPGIAALGVAAEQACAWITNPKAAPDLRARRDAFERRLLDAIPGARVHAQHAERLPNTISLAIPGVEAETLVLALSERGVCISAGAACASGSIEPSPVLRAMRVPDELAAGTIRISLSRFTTQRELDDAFDHIVACATLATAGGERKPNISPTIS